MITFHIASRRQPFTVHEDGHIECCVTEWDRAIQVARSQAMKKAWAKRKATNGTPNNNTQPL